MRLPGRETLKDVFWGTFLFIVVALMIDQIDHRLPLRKEQIEIGLFGLGSIAAYLGMLKRARSNVLGRRYARAALFCAVMFATGALVGIVHGFTDGWDWPDVGLVVPALLAWFCLKGLFHVASPGRATPSSGADSA